MKKWLVITIVILGLLLASVYVLFPRLVDVSNIKEINCNINSINRFLMVEDKWAKWWPGSIEHDSISNKNTFVYKGYKYVITANQYNAIAIQTRAKEFTINGTIFFLPVNNDSLEVQWKYILETNSNPLNRIYLYWETRKVNNNMMEIMKSMKVFLEKQENVYGMKIEKMRVKDTILVTTKFFSNEYPSTAKIYELINDIKNYIAVNNAKETNVPMLHVWKDSGMFNTMVAIPVDRKIPENKSYSIKRMVPGNILVSEVTGGTYKTRDAMNQLEIFMSDYHLSSPAIPFESLITNRMSEPDTSKWVTKIYYPVF